MEQNSKPIFPNPIFFLTMTLIIFIFGTLRQMVDPIKIENQKIFRKLLISSLPPVLGVIEIYKWVKKNRNTNIDISIIAGMIVLGVTMGLISLAFIVLLVLLYVFSNVSGQALYFLLIGILGYIGIAFSTSNIFYSSERNINIEENTSILKNINLNSSLFLTKIFDTHNKRLVWGISIFILVLFISMISPESFPPIAL